MKDQLEARLRDLRAQQAAGEATMAEIGRRQDDLRATLLRIGGAIQVLEELLAAAEAPPPAPGGDLP